MCPYCGSDSFINAWNDDGSTALLVHPDLNTPPDLQPEVTGIPGNSGQCEFGAKATRSPRPCGIALMPLTKAMEGWWCTRSAGHDGPCAAVNRTI